MLSIVPRNLHRCWPREWKRPISLRTLPIFPDANDSIPAKWRLRNERRNSILMTRYYPDLGMFQISRLARKICFNQSVHYLGLGSDVSSVWNFCSRFFRDFISRGNYTSHQSYHGLGGYSKLINGLKAAASGASVCWRPSLLFACSYIM